MDLFIKFLAGLFIGVANVIPGVSGGTVAVVLGVYEELLILTSFDFTKIFAKFKIFFFLFLGVLVGVLFFAKIVTFAYKNFPTYTNFFFTGIILGSIPMIFDLMEKSKSENRFNMFVKIIAFMLAFFLMILLFFANQKAGLIQNNVLDLNIKEAFILFFVGILAAVTMLIPGVSGSFLLLVLGYYETVMNAISNYNFLVLAIFGIGVLLGLSIASRVLIFVLKRFSGVVYSVILGLVLGSILQILPMVRQSVFGFLISGLCLLFGVLLILGFTKLNKNN